ncbi:hypothetical protein BJX70DRAFT_395286 [Aspergillus crustosus]
MSFRVEQAWVMEGPYGHIMGESELAPSSMALIGSLGQLLKLLQEKGVILTACSGNDGENHRPANWDYPVRFGIDPDDNIRNELIIAGAINAHGEEADHSLTFTPSDPRSEHMVYAPGQDIDIPGGLTNEGTSAPRSSAR